MSVAKIDEFYKVKYVVVKEETDTGEGCRKYADGSLCWHKNGLVHRGDDMPAVIAIYGAKWWYKNGINHRDGDKPAIIGANGHTTWVKNGKLHRDNDLPAIEGLNDPVWAKNGVEYIPDYIKARNTKSEEKKQPAEHNKCTICQDADVTHMFTKCHHVCVCNTCVAKIGNNKCPVCREQSSTVRVYVS